MSIQEGLGLLVVVKVAGTIVTPWQRQRPTSAGSLFTGNIKFDFPPVEFADFSQSVFLSDVGFFGLFIDLSYGITGSGIADIKSFFF